MSQNSKMQSSESFFSTFLNSKHFAMESLENLDDIIVGYVHFENKLKNQDDDVLYVPDNFYSRSMSSAFHSSTNSIDELEETL